MNMYKTRLEEYADFLFFIALKKCGNADEANDLTQETFLSALSLISKGGAINNMKSWLTSVLNRKYYDMLRKKYRQPTIYFDEMPELSDDGNIEDDIIMAEEAENIRREVAYLSKMYRDIVVSHYMENMSVTQIAENLGVSASAIKTRLSEGREKIKKGIDNVEKYSKLSYKPEGLRLFFSGIPGLSNEPWSLVNNDLLVQNILIAAYDKPLTEDEIGKQIGVATGYVEPRIQILVDNELMKRVSNKVYTDFIIYKPENVYFNHISEQQKLVDDNFDLFWSPLHGGLDKLRQLETYKNLNERAKNKLECHFTAWCLDTAIVFNAGEKIFGKQTYTDRPNGGKWNAQGYIKPELYNLPEHTKYRYYGLRSFHFKDYLNTRNMWLQIYNTAFDLNVNLTPIKYNMSEKDLTQLLYITSENINPNEAGYNIALLENIPAFIERGYFAKDNDRLKIDIPVATQAEYNKIRKIVEDTAVKIENNIIYILADYLKNRAVPIPKHLKNVQNIKLYMESITSILMMVIYGAKEKGYILKDVDYPCPAVMLVKNK